MNTPSIQIAGKRIELGKRLGRGGEGDVYALSGHADLAVKIYKEDKRTSRESKVRAMVESRLADKTDLVAFPGVVATDSSGAFLGFAMRLVSGYRPVHELYSPKSRKIQFPKADFRFLVRAAQNIARAVATVHNAGCVIGDFNHSGVLVASNATVALIDADSFQFTANGRSFPCLVGTEDFTPPELHGLSLANTKRTRAHDNFGLAVAIFQLLSMGKHPYAGRYSGADLSLGQAIAQHRFAYSTVRKNDTRTTPPPGAIQLADFPTPISMAFEAAFGLDPASRPDASCWVILLKELEANLRRCPTTPTHYFPHTASSCIWCRIESQSGVEMFPANAIAGHAVGTHGAPFDFSKIVAAIRSTSLPRPESILPTWTGNLPPSLPAVERARTKLVKDRLVGWIIMFAAAVAFVYLPKGFLLWITAGLLGIHLAKAKIDPSPIIQAYIDADNRVRSISLAYLQRIGLTEMYRLRQELESYIDQYQHIEGNLARELQRLRGTREARQKHAFLDRFLISRVKISGIGPAKQATLASFGIESAADINSNAVMAVPGFGESLTNKLLQWRREQEAKFRYNPSPDPADRQAEDSARSAAAAQQATFQNKLRSGLATLQSATSRFASSKANPDAALMRALAERAVAERDCATLGIKLPPHQPLELTAPNGPLKTQPSPTRNSTPGPSHTAQASATSSIVRCPACNAKMVRRKAKRGPNAGRAFWGCSLYPTCKGTRN
ncbi:protein kinase domain-containing protein [Pseudomonas sp.]|uniref:helix-hairpin-helix domain-containing protein n=1 Tax=Pseudomonas sp. TaxID=306 RepID=UPI0028A73C39|nr:topoisomerase DNA-binding C4 zinc finger domain-containing protein [Pseudomonas sp.]